MGKLKQKYKMKTIKQTPPFTIQVEPTEGCNLGCKFCGLRGMRKNGTKPWKFMTIETAERIASETERVGWKAKIVFAVHGEPILNPNFKEIVKVFRKHLPKAILHMYTNGIWFGEKTDPDKEFNELFDAGMDDVLVDCYTNSGIKFIDKLDAKQNIVILEPGVPFYTMKHERRILLMPSLQSDDKNKATRRLANHAGAAFPLDKSFNNKRCAMPFREMSVRWDGWVTICCDDFRGAYRIGNINQMKIDEIWNHPRFQVARIMLYNYNRNFAPCDGCTNISPRVGFLPDPSGHETLPEITDEIEKLAKSVFKQEGYLAEIVKRPWDE